MNFISVIAINTKGKNFYDIYNYKELAQSLSTIFNRGLFDLLVAFFSI